MQCSKKPKEPGTETGEWLHYALSTLWAAWPVLQKHYQSRNQQTKTLFTVITCRKFITTLQHSEPCCFVAVFSKQYWAISTRQCASPPAREWPSVHPEQAPCLLTLLLTLAGVWASPHKLNKVKMFLLPGGRFHQCQQRHLIAGLRSHIWQKVAWSLFHFWLEILLHPNLQVFIKKAEIPKALLGVLPQSLWLPSGGSIARRGSQAAEESKRSAITLMLSHKSCPALSSGALLLLKTVKESPGVGPKAEQSGIRYRHLFEGTYTAKESVCSDHSKYYYKSQRN